MKEEKEGKKEKVSLDEFKEALRIFKSLLNSGDMDIKFSPSSNVVSLETDRLDEELTSSKIDNKTFAICEREIIRYLNNILRDKEKKFLKRYPGEEREEVEKKCERVEKEIITEELVENFLFQTTCKNYLFEFFDWEMMEHRGKEEEGSFSTVMMAFKLRNPSKDLPWSPPFQGYESIGFECRKKDIEKLLEELEKIKKRFEK
ncbi:MAG: hypothetical protein H8D26_06225 [Methanomicrobia archaeon]|nr:hypothetical protein [Methanomicrobia archaeon]